MMRTWRQTARNEEVVNENEPNTVEPANKKERDKKRWKLMKGLKKWTGTVDEGERKFKGWSDNGHKAFEQWTMSIKNDVRSGKYTIWEKAFREVHAKQQEVRISEDQPVKKYTVNRSVVWEL
jgi:hypothetical protein